MCLPAIPRLLGDYRPLSVHIPFPGARIVGQTCMVLRSLFVPVPVARPGALGCICAIAFLGAATTFARLLRHAAP